MGDTGKTNEIGQKDKGKQKAKGSSTDFAAGKTKRGILKDTEVESLSKKRKTSSEEIVGDTIKVATQYTPEQLAGKLPIDEGPRKSQRVWEKGKKVQFDEKNLGELNKESLEALLEELEEDS